MEWFHRLAIRNKIFILTFTSIVSIATYLFINIWTASANARMLKALQSVYFSTLQTAERNIARLDRIKDALAIGD